MKHKYVKIKKLKIGLQTMKAAVRHLEECDMCYGYRTGEMAMMCYPFFQVAKILRMEPIIETGYSQQNPYYAYFYYEGWKMYCIYDENENEKIVKKSGVKTDLAYSLAKRWMEGLKEHFFVTGDKELAFQQLRENEIKEYIDPKKVALYWMKSYHDFDRYVSRHSKEAESYESRYSKYQAYKETFEPLDEDMSYDEAKMKRPAGDWSIPLTFRQWNKFNY